MSSDKRLLVIVPDLPPNINGVGDYANVLIKQLKQIEFDYKVEVLVAGNTEYDASNFIGFGVIVLKNKTSEVLFQTLCHLKPSIMHLHYVGYGYAKRGAPLWLVLGIERYKKSCTVSFFVTFHELYATSYKPWTSSFWNQIFQIWICRRIYYHSKVAITNRMANKFILNKFKYDIPIQVMPVFSNFPEPQSNLILTDRKKQLVVLGSSSNRSFVYKNFSNEILEICRNLNLNKIIDIGPDCTINSSISIDIEKLGVLPGEDIVSILTESYAGVLGFHSEQFLAKSGIFAAYSSCGVLAIVLNKISGRHFNYSNLDGLYPNFHYVYLDTLLDLNHTKISERLFEWYSLHNLRVQAEFYKKLFLEN